MTVAGNRKPASSAKFQVENENTGEIQSLELEVTTDTIANCISSVNQLCRVTDHRPPQVAGSEEKLSFYMWYVFRSDTWTLDNGELYTIKFRLQNDGGELGPESAFQVFCKDY
jgi:hypothetical protein